MKLLALSFFFSLFSVGKPAWLTNFDEAKQLAKEKHEYIILNFSGSDWCGPCIKMHQEIFENETFLDYASSSLVLVNADFPRLKKHQLTADQQKINNSLADQYNPHGIFPYTLLLDTNGRVLKSWEGFFEPGTARFIDDIKSTLNDQPR